MKRSKSALDPDDREIVETFQTWDSVLEWLLNGAPPSVKLIRPALSHLIAFPNFFLANIGQDIDVSYLWGSLACLLMVSIVSRLYSVAQITYGFFLLYQLVSEYVKPLENVPRIVKSLALKAEAFNHYCARTLTVTSPIKEVCFDMLFQYVEFFTTAIGEIRTAGKGRLCREIRPTTNESKQNQINSE